MRDYRTQKLRIQYQNVNLPRMLTIVTVVLAIFFTVAFFPRTQPEVIFEENKLPHRVSAIFLTCCGRYDMLETTLSSFFQYNQTPLERMVLVNDGVMNAQLIKIMKKYPNISLLTTGKGQGQIRAVDLGLRFIKTPYVYYSQDDRRLYKKGVIQHSIQALQKEPKLLQLWTANHIEDEYIMKDGLVSVQAYWQGFSFYPAVWRMKDYWQIKGGFHTLTRDVSRGTGCGTTENSIMFYYRAKGYYVRQVQYYYENLGIGKGNARQG